MTAARATGMRITAMRPEHAEQVLVIHQLGIDEGNATFETNDPTWKRFDTVKLPEHRLVALGEDESVLGWAAVASVNHHGKHVHLAKQPRTPSWSGS